MKRVELIELIREHAMTAPEVIKYLDISKQALSSLVSRGKLTPIKESGAVRLFLRADVEARKKEAEELRGRYRPYD